MINQQTETLSSVDKFLNVASQIRTQIASKAATHDEEASFPFENFQVIRDKGFHKLTVPQEYGGLGFDIEQLVAIQQEIAKGDASTALVLGMHLSLIGRQAESRDWEESFFEFICREIVEKGAIINSAATEPQMGSPSRGGLPQTRAYKKNDGWVLSGRKSFVTGAPILDYFIVLAAIDDRRASFLVPRGSDGLSIEETWNTLGMRASGSHDLLLEEVFVPDEFLIIPKESQVPANSGRVWSALTLSAIYLGIAKAAQEFIVDFCKNRIPSALGKPIAELEHVQHALGEIAADIRIAETILETTAKRWTQNIQIRDKISGDVALTKYTCTNCAVKVTDKAMRIAGGSALSKKLPLERYFRDARAGLYNPPADHETLRMLGMESLGLATRLT